jgi:hypothetical protein
VGKGRGVERRIRPTADPTESNFGRTCSNPGNKAVDASFWFDWLDRNFGHRDFFMLRAVWKERYYLQRAESLVLVLRIGCSVPVDCLNRQISEHDDPGRWAAWLREQFSGRSYQQLTQAAKLERFRELSKEIAAAASAMIDETGLARDGAPTAS